MSGMLDVSKTKRGFVSRKQGGFLFSGWRTEWWEVSPIAFNGFASPDNSDTPPLVEVKPKRAWKVTKLGKTEFLVHWKEGGSLHFKANEGGEEDRDVWVDCITCFLESTKAAKLMEEAGEELTVDSPKAKDTFDVSVLKDTAPIPKPGSFGSLLGLIRPARLDVSDDALSQRASTSAAASSPHGPQSSPHGTRLSNSTQSSPFGGRASNSKSPVANLQQQAGNLPRLGSSQDLASSMVFMGKASNFAQKIAQEVDRSNQRKEFSPRGGQRPPLQREESLNRQEHHALPIASQLEAKIDPNQFSKTPEQTALLVSTISQELWALLSQSVMRIAPPQALVDLMYSVTIPANHTMVVQGQQVDKLYIIETGRVGVYSVDFVDNPRGELEYVKKRGDCFFVHSLLYHQPGPFTITTHVECKLWALSLKQFNDFMTLQTKKVVVRKLKLLEGVPLLANSLEFETIVQLADCLEFQEMRKGDWLVREGDLVKKLYVLDEGEVSIGTNTQPLVRGQVFGEWALLANIRSKMHLQVCSDTALVLVLDIEEMEELIGPLRKYVLQTRHGLPTPTEEIELAKLIPVQDDDQMFKFAFGSSEEDNKIIRMATLAAMQRFTKQISPASPTSASSAAQAKEAMTTAATMGAGKSKIFGRKSFHPDASFSKLMMEEEAEVVEDLEEDIDELNMDLEYELKPAARPELVLSELHVLAQLGSGQFGVVHLAECIGKGNPVDRVAIKVMSAAGMVDNGWEKMIECERNSMLELAGNPFLVSLLNYGSHNARQIYLVMELCEWGTLTSLVRVQPECRLSTEAQARFYLANIVLAIEFMHSKDIIYRDLKTENIMVTSTGYCKLADFGLAKKTSQTYTFCGTPDFMAPEILLRKGHGSAVDWWACGVLLFELLSGETPFAGYETTDIYERVLAHVDPKQLVYPAQCEGLTEGCKNLIQNLLHPKRAKRLGAKFPGVLGIKRHAFFEGLDWDELEKQTVVAPLLPSRNQPPSPPLAGAPTYDSETKSAWDLQRQDKTGWADKFAVA
ncbi:hypothetical protein BASA81_002281 [Batrachochytrium salamandrivorans]|nr:hypothetical protein BASA81_002281 [Batrachochytrium salamandrivorans]